MAADDASASGNEVSFYTTDEELHKIAINHLRKLKIVSGISDELKWELAKN